MVGAGNSGRMHRNQPKGNYLCHNWDFVMNGLSSNYGHDLGQFEKIVVVNLDLLCRHQSLKGTAPRITRSFSWAVRVTHRSISSLSLPCRRVLSGPPMSSLRQKVTSKPMFRQRSATTRCFPSLFSASDCCYSPLSPVSFCVAIM